MNPEKFVEFILFEMGINNPSQKMEKLSGYTDLMLKWNKKFNITSIDNRDEIYLKHHLDSIAVFPFIHLQGSEVVDIGTGAGLPGIPLKIIYPDFNLTLVESKKKKVNFLKLVINEFAFDNVNILSERVEDIGQKNEYRGNFDLGFSRAVAGLNVLVEYGLPLIKTGGYLVSWEKRNINDLLIETEEALNILNSNYEKRICYCDWLESKIEKDLDVNNLDKDKYFLFIKKLGDTPPEYPRKAGVPKKRPL